MPGEISRSYEGPPICRCEHFKDLHDFKINKEGACEVEECTCRAFDETPFDDSELGQAIDKFLKQDQ